MKDSHGDFNEPLSLENTRIVGSCTGLLSAAAVSCSQTLPQLLDVSIELLRVSFHVGVAILEERDEIIPGDNGPQSWSAVVSGISKDAASAAIDEFHSAAVRISFTIPLNAHTMAGALRHG